MKIEYVHQSLLDARSPFGETVLIQGCNNRGAMGSGIAKAIFTKWPVVREAYMSKTEYILGTADYVQVEEGVHVLNGITQDGYGYDGGVYAQAEAIASVIRFAAIHPSIDELFMPLIGAGLGGLDWSGDVVPAIEAIDIDKKVTVCLI